MQRYILQIVTQAYLKAEVFMPTLWQFIFGNSQGEYTALDTIFFQQGFALYQPFGDSFIATVSLLPYGNKVVRQSIKELKFHNNYFTTRYYGQLAGEVLLELLSELEETHDFRNCLLCVVPAHKSTVRTRHGCSNTKVGKVIARMGIVQTYEPRLVVKTRPTLQQSRTRNKKERIANVRDTFALNSKYAIDGRNIIVIDDVYTTGATLNEVSTLLEQAGARRVLRLTLAH